MTGRSRLSSFLSRTLEGAQQQAYHRTRPLHRPARTSDTTRRAKRRDRAKPRGSGRANAPFGPPAPTELFGAVAEAGRGAGGETGATGGRKGSG